MSSRLPLRIAALFIFMLGMSVAATATPSAEPPAVRVVVYADGEARQFTSPGIIADSLLAEAGVQLEEGDRLFQNGLQIDARADLSGSDPIVLQVQRAVAAAINGRAIRTSAPTVLGALWESGLHVRISDVLLPAPQQPLSPELAITHTTASVVRIRIGAETLSARTAADTVGDALQDAGVALQGLDYSIPDADAPVPLDDSIQVIRVEEEILLEQKSISFDTLTQPVEDLELDSTQVVQVGQFGLRASRIRVRYENGVEVSRITEAEWTAVEPKPRILGYGTKIVVRTMNTPNGTIEYWRAVPAFATSYSPCRLGIETCGSTTASGLPLKKGVVGVIRSWYNAMVFTQVYVPGYGVGVVADIGGGVPGRNWIDLGYSDDDWVSWAANTTIYFLTPVPPPDQILWVLP